MKLTAITNEAGDILATFRGHSKEFEFGDFKAGLDASKDQRHHEIDVPDEFERMGPVELHKNVAAHLKKPK